MSIHIDHATAPEDRLSFGQKFAYGLGAIANNMLGGAIGFMSVVLNVGLGMNPALVGTLQAIPRFTDAITDPVMGYVSDHTRSRYGRRRPYIFFGAIFVGLIFALMWQLPAGYSEMFYFCFFLTGSILGRDSVVKIIDKIHFGKEIPEMNKMDLIRVTRANLGGWSIQIKAWGYEGVPRQYLTYVAD